MAQINKYLLLGVLISMTPTAFALTGDDIYKKCSKALDVPKNEKQQQAITRFLDVGTCAGFVGGVLSGVNLVGDMMQQQGIVKRNFICLPKEQHSQALLKEVIHYLDEHKNELKLPAQVIIYKAFSQKYPCKPTH
ncbi:MAG: hypothetical protein methR_P3879 [Methyloprofundus sp.]|nr:MAG: hypothetical protein methR_P3879 [Methyloprofundus sp.]